MAWYDRTKLNELSEKITDSIKQLEVYFSEKHVINPEYLLSFGNDIRKINIEEQLGMLEITTNFVEEMKSLTE